MRVIIACVLSFVLALIVGIFVLAGTGPAHKSKPKPKPTKSQAQAAPNLEMLPALPSLRPDRIEVPLNQYEEAEQLLKARKYREAKNAYLQILMHQPHDRKAIDGLVVALRLRANQDPQKLQEDAAGYRRAIVEGRVTEEHDTPREMELLAEASLSAANQIKAEQQVGAAVSPKVAMIAPPARPAVSGRLNATRSLPSPPAQPIVAAQPTAKPAGGRPPASQTTVAAEARASRASRRQATSTAVPVAAAPRPQATPAAVPPAAPSRPAATSTGVPPTTISRPPVTPATVPPVVAPPREKSTPDGTQTQTPDVTQVNPPGTAAQDGYVLGPGDQIEVNVPHLAMTVTINQDGVIALPLISPVKAAGKTTAQLASDLTAMYSKVLQAPSVTVFVRQSRMSR